MVSIIQPSSPPESGSLTREAALDTIALAATLLFAHGQTTERTVVVAERLGRALGVPVTALPYWGQLTVEIDGTTLSKIVPAKPLGVDMGKVLAVTTVVDQVCDGKLEAAATRSALALAGRLPPASTLRFTLLAAVGAASLGVIFGVIDATSLLLIAASAAIGAFVRRWLSGFSGNPFIQPLCAATIGGAVAGAAGRLELSEAITLIAFCPCMVLVPGPHLLNGAIDLARTRIALGIARLAYAGVIVLMICAGLWFGLDRYRRNSSGCRILGTDAAGSRRDCSRLRRCRVRHLFLDAMASTAGPDRRRHVRARGALGRDLDGIGECCNRRLCRLYHRQRHRHAGCQPSASSVRGARLLCGRLDDAGFLLVPRRERPGRAGLDRATRPGGPADERRRERDHGVSGYPGHDPGADPAAPAVRALSACARMKGGKDVLWIATPFNMRRSRRGTKDRAGASWAPHQVHR